MTWLLITVLLTAIHFGVFWRVLRDRQALKSERGIFRFHFWYSLSLTSLTVILTSASFISLADAVGAVAVLGIYNLSFLEMWSLSEGSYSLGILLHGINHGRVGAADLTKFVAVGTAKHAARVEALRRLGFLAVGEGEVKLTRRGQAVAAAIAMLAFLSNAKRTG